LPYEAFRILERPSPGRERDLRAAPAHELPIWFRYDAVLRVDGQVTALGEDRAAVDRLLSALERPMRAPGAVRLQRMNPLGDEAHLRRIARAKQLILDGDLYLVNLARRFEFAVDGDDLDLFQRMAQHSQPPFGAYLNFGETRVCSSSPELFLKLAASGALSTAPIKGTRPRHADPDRDHAIAAELDHDAKERAELAMVIDVERNDLARIAQVGSVCVSQQPRVVPCGQVWHRMAEVTAQLNPVHDRAALLRAMAPSGSVTGAPKVRAMEVIAQLEAARRGLYTGALGFIGHDGAMTLSMAIRSLVLSTGEATYFAGGGIVLDSDAAQELEETEWKARQLSALCDS
jgi:anthranilate/para-aminobenzoate synthase component I